MNQRGAMHTNPDKMQIQENRQAIWRMIDALDELPRYPAIVRRVDITASEEEYFDHELSYEEKYDEELHLREGFIIAALEATDQVLGVGDCVILDCAKRALLRAPRVARCGLVLPMIPYQGSIQQPLDYLTYFDTIQVCIQEQNASFHKHTLRCPKDPDGSHSTAQV